MNNQDDQKVVKDIIINPSQIKPGVIDPRHLVVPTTPVNGDMFYSDGTNFKKIAAGASGQALVNRGGLPVWGTGGGSTGPSGPTGATGATGSTGTTGPTGASLSSKIITSTRDLSAATATAAYTGVGFKPTSMIAWAEVDGTTQASWGMVDSSGSTSSIIQDPSGNMLNNDNVAVIRLIQNIVGPVDQFASFSSFDTDGFTLVWTRRGATTAATANLKFLCYK